MISRISVVSFLAILLMSCSYSFTGSSLTPEMTTIYIKQFPNTSALQNPNLSIDFSTALQTRFVQRTNLAQTDVQPNLLIEGEITGYSTTPINIQSGNDRASQNRLTVTVKVKYTNSVDPTKSFTRSYSEYADYPASELLNVVQDDLSRKINEKLIDRIFNDIVADW